MIDYPMPLVCTSHSNLIAGLTLLSIMETTSTSPLVVKCHHPIPNVLGCSHSHCIYMSQFSDCSPYYKFCPTQESNHRALWWCQVSPHKYISQSTGQRYVFWIFLVTFPTPVSLWILPPTLKPVSSAFLTCPLWATFFKSMFQPPNQPNCWSPFLTPRATH